MLIKSRQAKLTRKRQVTVPGIGVGCSASCWVLVLPLTQYFCTTEIRLKLTSRAGARSWGETQRPAVQAWNGSGPHPLGKWGRLALCLYKPRFCLLIHHWLVPPCTEDSVKPQPQLVFYFPPNEHTWDAHPWARLDYRLQHRYIRLWLGAGPSETPLPSVPLRKADLRK